MTNKVPDYFGSDYGIAMPEPVAPVADPFRTERQGYQNPFSFDRVEPVVKESVTDFNTNPEVLERFDRVMTFLGENDTFTNSLLDSKSTPSETLRDDNINIMKLLDKTAALKDAPDQIKKDYAYLKDRFENTKITGAAEYFDMFQDYGTDLVTDPVLLAGLIGGFFTGGTTTAATVGAQATARAALANTLKRVATGAGKLGTTGAVSAGALTGGAYDLAGQNLDIAINRKDEIDVAQFFATTALGGAVGGVGQGLNKFLFGQSKVNKQTVEDAFEEVYEEKKSFFGNRTRKGETYDMEGTSYPALIGIPGPAEMPAKRRFVDRLEGATAKAEESAVKGETIDLDSSEWSVILDDLVEEVGGGQQTRAAVADDITAAMASSSDPRRVRSNMLNALSRRLSRATSTMFFGKAAGVLSPYASYSPTAKILQGKFSREFDKVWRGNQYKIEGDFFEAQQEIFGSLYTRYVDIVEPLAYNRIKGKLKDKVNADLSAALRGQRVDNEAVTEAAAQIKQLYSEIGDRLVRNGVIDEKVEDYVPRMWNRSSIENNKSKFARLLVEEGEAANTQDALKIVDDLLDKQNQLDSGTVGHFFSAKRKFNNISNDYKFEEFLNTDVIGTFYNYSFHTAKALAKKKVFGVRNEAEFTERWINKIVDDHFEATGKSLSKVDREALVNLYRTTTGENLDSFDGLMRTGVDAYGLVNRLAYLSQAALSSLSEVALNISNAGFVNSVKGLGEALELSFKYMSDDIETVLKNNPQKLTTAEIKREMYEFGLSLDQSISQVGNRLTGDELYSETMQNVSNGFFKLTFLEQWTKFAQTASYTTGKRLIMNNIRDVAEHGNAKVSSRIQNKLDELNELGIDVDAAKQWYQSGGSLQDEFYSSIKKGAVRYANDIILQPNAMSGLRPTLYSNPKTQIAFQLLSYPAAFTNVILKGAAKKITRNPTQNTAAVLATGLIMTEMQRGIQWLKSGGTSERDLTPFEARIEGLKRTGAPGLVFQQFERAKKSSEFTGTLAPFAAVPFGPLGTDVTSAVYEGRPFRTLSTKMPFYSMYGNVAKATGNEQEYREYQDFFKRQDNKLRQALRQEQPLVVREEFFAKGGLVEVPNASSEPDERIDKMTGQPYNIQAGSAFVDEEDPEKRLLFSLGGIVAEALGISEEGIKWAKSMSKKYPEVEELDGRGDAARHLALGWLAKQSNYPSFSKFAANAREFIEFDVKGGAMDIENNNRGFDINASTFEEAEKEIERLINSGEVTYYTPKESKEMRGY